MGLTVSELAEALSGTVEGEGEVVLDGVEGLESAGPAHLSFLSNPRYRGKLHETRAGAVLVDASLQVDGQITLIRVADPYLAFARALSLFHPQVWPEPGIHPHAWISGEAQIGEQVCVEAFASIGPKAVVGAGSWIQGTAFVGPGAVLGEGCRLMPGSVVMEGCVLGAGVWLNPGAVVGSEGFGFARGPEGWEKIPQVGSATVGAGAEIGANSCVDRAALGETRVGAGARLDNLCQVGHGAWVGEDTLMVAYSGVAGSSRLGPSVTLAARTSVLGHLEIGEGTQVAAHSMVSKDTEPGDRLAGVPAHNHAHWLRETAATRRLPDLLKDIEALGERVKALEAALEGKDSP